MRFLLRWCVPDAAVRCIGRVRFTQQEVLDYIVKPTMTAYGAALIDEVYRENVLVRRVREARRP